MATVQLVACAELDTTPGGSMVGAYDADTTNEAVEANDALVAVLATCA